jgi:hypothetical protein
LVPVFGFGFGYGFGFLSWFQFWLFVLNFRSTDRANHLHCWTPVEAWEKKMQEALLRNCNIATDEMHRKQYLLSKFPVHIINIGTLEYDNALFLQSCFHSLRSFLNENISGRTRESSLRALYSRKS